MFERLTTVQVSDDNQAFLSLVFIYRWAKCPFSRLLIYVNLFVLLAACDFSKFVSQKARPVWSADKSSNKLFQCQSCRYKLCKDLEYVLKLNERNHNLEHEPSFAVYKSRNATLIYVVQCHKFIFLTNISPPSLKTSCIFTCIFLLF